jgi:hypothetical protein
MIGRNLVKDLKPDEDGYYRVVLGDYSEHSLSGRKYSEESISKAFVNRIKRSPMYVELGYPNLRDLSDNEKISRTMQVDENRMCGVITIGSLDGSKMIGKFKPLGPYGNVVRDMLCEPNEELCFGMRSINKPAMWPYAEVIQLATFDLIAPPPKGAVEVIHHIAVTQKPDPVLEVEVRGNLPHIGKSRVMEVIKRALEKNGYAGVKVIKQDNDQTFWDARHDEELRASDSLTTMSITLIDNNQKPVGAKA